MKEIARLFSASFEFNETRKEELRLLTQPLLRYSDSESGVVDGAVFSAAANGTNPTVMFLVELQEVGAMQVWRFAVAAMTDGGLVVKYDGKEVWRKAALHAPGKDFDTWTYFFDSRKN